MKERKYNFKKDTITLYRCKDFNEIEKDIEDIFIINKKILPGNKRAKILIKPNFNNDLNSMTGNSTDLRVIISVIKSLKKRKYTNITIADGPNCGINHVGIDVFSRLCIDKIAKKYNVKLLNFNNDSGTIVKLTNSNAEIGKTCLDSDFIINIPKIKTHVEAKISIASKNYIGCFKGTNKRRIHDNLHENILVISKLVKSHLIIVDGLIGMEGRGPGDGIPKKLGVILSGHDNLMVDFLCSKLMGLDYNKIPCLKLAKDYEMIEKEDLETLDRTNNLRNFIPGEKKFLDKVLLNNFFIGIRFSKTFERFFNKGILPKLLFKIKVKQDKYITQDPKIEKIYLKDNLTKTEKERLDNCLKEYCPMKIKRLDDKECIECMYCYQKLPEIIKIKGEAPSIEMQNQRFGKYIRED